jgi:TRAP-type uncharacterized transport system substrate-binding protein
MKHKLLSTAAAISAAVLFATSASAQSVTVLGGGLKGGAYAMAVGLSKVLKDEAGINVSPQTSGGMVAQARLLAKGDAQLGLGLITVNAALKKKVRRKTFVQSPRILSVNCSGSHLQTQRLKPSAMLKT